MWWLSKSSHGHKRSHHKLTTHLSMVQRWPDDHLSNGESIIKVCTRSYHVFNILCVWSKHVNEWFTLIVKDSVCARWRFEEHHTHITGKCQSADETKRRNIKRVFSSYYSSCAWKVIPAQNETHPCGVCHDLETLWIHWQSLRLDPTHHKMARVSSTFENMKSAAVFQGIWEDCELYRVFHFDGEETVREPCLINIYSNCDSYLVPFRRIIHYICPVKANDHKLIFVKSKIFTGR